MWIVMVMVVVVWVQTSVLMVAVTAMIFNAWRPHSFDIIFEKLLKRRRMGDKAK